jgi:hypothetical protein
VHIAENGKFVWMYETPQPGADAQWGTEDDPVSLLWHSAYDDEDRLVERRQFGDPGADGDWRTAARGRA